MICCLGRPVEEARYAGASRDQSIASNIAEIDVEMATDALKHATGAPPLDVTIRAACRVVELEWPRIDRLAIQLCRRRQLDLDECRRLVTARR